MIYLYDGSFDGLLTAIFEAYSNNTSPTAILSANDLQMGLLEEYATINPDTRKSNRVQAGILSHMGTSSLEQLFTAHLTPHADRGTVIYRYLRLGFKIGPKVCGHYADPDVMCVEKMQQQVLREIQHIQGFMRFRSVDDAYYADFSPDNDILELIAPHFADRFNDQHFIIEDKKRNKMIASADGEWLLLQGENITLPPTSKQEAYYNALWREFHRAVTINERINLKQQRLMLPKRYRKYMLEMQANPMCELSGLQLFLP